MWIDKFSATVGRRINTALQSSSEKMTFFFSTNELVIWWLSSHLCTYRVFFKVFKNLGKVPGTSRGVTTHDKGHAERIWHAKVNQNSRGPPGPVRASTPKPKSVCFTISRPSPTLLTLTGGYPRPPFPKENQFRGLVIKSPGHNRNVSIQTPLMTF